MVSPTAVQTDEVIDLCAVAAAELRVTELSERHGRESEEAQSALRDLGHLYELAGAIDTL